MVTNLAGLNPAVTPTMKSRTAWRRCRLPWQWP